MARLKPDLSLDAWVPVGVPAGSLLAASPAPGSPICAAAVSKTIDGGQMRIVRLLDDGTVDSAFPAILLPPFTGRYSNPFNRLEVRPDGSLIVEFWQAVDVATSAGTLGSTRLRYSAAGVLDEAWSRAAAVAGTARVLTFADNGSALLAEFETTSDLFGHPPHPWVRRLEPNGGIGPRLAEAQRKGAIGPMTVRADGAVVASRDGLFLNTTPPFTAINGASWTKAAWLREDGSLDPNFGFETAGSTGSSFILAGSLLLFDGSDRLLVTGRFSQFNGVPRAGLARLNAERTTDLDFVPELPQNFSRSRCPRAPLPLALSWARHSSLRAQVALRQAQGLAVRQAQALSEVERELVETAGIGHNLGPIQAHIAHLLRCPISPGQRVG